LETLNINNPQAVVTFEETLGVAPAAITRMLGSELFVQGYQAVGVVVGLVAGVLLSIALNKALPASGAAAPPSSIGGLLTGIGAICGWAAGLSLAQRAHLKRFLAAIRKRGTPAEIAVTFALTDKGRNIDTQRIRYLIAYEAILEVIETATSWLLQVDVTTINLPKRAFGGDRATELAFIEQMLDRMNPEAQARSDKPQPA
jgi:hypothetical protein